MRESLQNYLHEHIPLSKAMQVEVRDASEHGVTLFAPLAPNINHRETVFGGSASAVAILAAWSLLHLRLKDHAASTRLVIQQNTMTYERAMTGGFSATSNIADPAAWQRFTETLTRRHRARIHVSASLHCNGERVGEFEGDFVALALLTP